MKTTFRQAWQFVAVGLGGFVVDMLCFNILRSLFLAAGFVHYSTIVASVLATLAAIAFNWVGNRLWTFASQTKGARSSRMQTLAEGARFLLASLAGMVVGTVPLVVSHYVFNIVDVAGDNTAKIVGLVVGSVLRFVLYKKWVYRQR